MEGKHNLQKIKLFSRLQKDFGITEDYSSYSCSNRKERYSCLPAFAVSYDINENMFKLLTEYGISDLEDVLSIIDTTVSMHGCSIDLIFSKKETFSTLPKCCPIKLFKGFFKKEHAGYGMFTLHSTVILDNLHNAIFKTCLAKLLTDKLYSNTSRNIGHAAEFDAIIYDAKNRMRQHSSSAAYSFLSYDGCTPFKSLMNMHATPKSIKTANKLLLRKLMHFKPLFI